LDFIEEVLVKKAVAGPGEQARTAAAEWRENGFEDAEEVAAWIDSGCRTPEFARSLEDAGITAEQAGMSTESMVSPNTRTIAEALLNGEIKISDARRIIENRFWNS
jgi:hypothetical protein